MRGIAMIGPMQRTITETISFPGILPMRPVSVKISPLFFIRATDVGHVIEDESQYPVRSGFQPQVRRKDYVPRSEKHGEESEADDEYVQIITFHCDCPS